MKLISFATGNLWRFHKSLNLIEFISNFDVDGIEYTYGRHLYERPIKDSDLKYFERFQDVSMHAPFCLVKESESIKHIKERLLVVEKDYAKIGGLRIVTHPNQVIPKNLLKDSKMVFMTENLNPKPGRDRPRNAFEKILINNSDFGLCLDVSHAYSWGVDETERIVKKWKKRIKQVHFSNNRYKQDHLMFHKVSRGFLKSIEPLQELNVPIVIEEDMKTKSIPKINSEIKKVKSILSI